MKPEIDFISKANEFFSFAKKWAVSIDTTNYRLPIPLRLPQRDGNRKKKAEATGDLVVNKMTEKTTRDASKSTREDQRKSTAIQIDETSVKPTVIPKDI